VGGWVDNVTDEEIRSGFSSLFWYSGALDYSGAKSLWIILVLYMYQRM
jgi:hypothetical protein